MLIELRQETAVGRRRGQTGAAVFKQVRLSAGHISALSRGPGQHVRSL